MTTAPKTPRYTDIPLPGKRYLPATGMAHPGKDPAGPHIPHIPPTAVAFDVETWCFSQRYLYAIDLFNYRYWWEAHEVLEDVWIDAGRKTPCGKFVQGIIQISAALLKASQATYTGARRLTKKGLSNIRLQEDIFLGVNIPEFSRQVEAYIKRESSAPPEIKLRLPD